MPRALSRSLLVAIASALAPVASAAQKPTVLFGVVTNLNGVRLAGVEMVIVNTTLQAVTNDSGQFLFDAPPTGRLRLSARRIGFKAQEKGFKLEVGDSRHVDFELEGLPDLLDSVLILGRGGNSRMAEFWNRRTIGLGAFVTRADIDRRKPYRASDLLRTVTGVRLIGGDESGRPVIQMGRTGVGMVGRRNVLSLAGECRVNYYVDGMWVPPGTFHIDDIAPMALEALEIYRGPSEIPAKFRQRETACGLIVIWTREPPPREESDTVGARRA